jgi:hypothetical protein
LARIAAFAGIVALLLQGALVAAHGAAPAPSGMPGGGYRLALGQPWLAAFCSGGATSHDPGAPAGSGTDHALPTCPLCQALQHVGPWFPPVVGWALTAPVGTAVTVLSASDLRPIPPTPGFTQARAPPALS